MLLSLVGDHHGPRGGDGAQRGRRCLGGRRRRGHAAWPARRRQSSGEERPAFSSCRGPQPATRGCRRDRRRRGPSAVVAALRGLRAHEAADEAAVHPRAPTAAGAPTGRPGISFASLGAVDPRHLDGGVLETRRLQFWRGSPHRAARRATQPIHSPCSGGWLRHLAAHHHVGHREAPARLEHAEASRSTRSLSADRLITQLEMITSTESEGSGMCLDLALQEVHVGVSPLLRLFSCARASICSVMSRP